MIKNQKNEYIVYNFGIIGNDFLKLIIILIDQDKEENDKCNLLLMEINIKKLLECINKFFKDILK